MQFKMSILHLEFPLVTLMAKKKRKMWNIYLTGSEFKTNFCLFFSLFCSYFSTSRPPTTFCCVCMSRKTHFILEIKTFKTVQWQCYVSLWWQAGQKSWICNIPWYLQSLNCKFGIWKTQVRVITTRWATT